MSETGFQIFHQAYAVGAELLYAGFVFMPLCGGAGASVEKGRGRLLRIPVDVFVFEPDRRSAGFVYPGAAPVLDGSIEGFGA